MWRDWLNTGTVKGLIHGDTRRAGRRVQGVSSRFLMTGQHDCVLPLMGSRTDQGHIA